ncbi:hypothetical protein Asp14428_07790 [Actinoplanes sp. NBRC 14428]|uniref:Universal stress protein family protein n=1 Tax=Pseudosporangium ferrugineum TaxID=439699 RepID=A0A2T0RKB1_9ACTN|nr:universal stress protein [Pseudosporangium ferrugineum]PRY21619.1 universal stress protein family protein [Pseudosporangium ferrugineum]BCJ49304.1 hypothetical protein Asp14428_07790 [Actinoplanes sp. NBRC 14428]
MRTPSSASPIGADALAGTVRALLRARRPSGGDLLISEHGLLVPGLGPGNPGDPVVAAIDDDENPRPILRYAAGEALRLRVPLRAVHVWIRRAPRDGARFRRHDRMSDADQLLSQVLYDHLSAAEADAAEREILCGDTPVPALVELSRSAGLIVLAARAPGGRGDAVGSTAGGLVGRTYCPLAVLTPAEPAG